MVGIPAVTRGAERSRHRFRGHLYPVHPVQRQALSCSMRMAVRALLLIAAATMRSEAAGAQACVGDCNSDGRVAVNEIVTMVNIGLGNTDASSCTRGDSDANGAITVNEIVAAVASALSSTEIEVVGTCEVPGGSEG